MRGTITPFGAVAAVARSVVATGSKKHREIKVEAETPEPVSTSPFGEIAAAARSAAALPPAPRGPMIPSPRTASR